ARAGAGGAPEGAGAVRVPPPRGRRGGRVLPPVERAPRGGPRRRGGVPGGGAARAAERRGPAPAAPGHGAVRGGAPRPLPRPGGEGPQP
ncbi:unnamed protein product, partial [Heterosigma akashiwo]